MVLYHWALSGASAARQNVKMCYDERIFFVMKIISLIITIIALSLIGGVLLSPHVLPPLPEAPSAPREISPPPPEETIQGVATSSGLTATSTEETRLPPQATETKRQGESSPQPSKSKLQVPPRVVPLPVAPPPLAVPKPSSVQDFETALPPAQEGATTTPAEAPKQDPRIVSAESLSARPIDIRTIVLVRCSFKSQYFAQSRQPWNETSHLVGSGILVSPNGDIITAAHILRFKKDPADLSDRIWSRESCGVVQTDATQSILASDGSPRLKQATILFEPSEDEYRDSEALDIALVRGEFGDSSLPYVPLFAQFIKFPKATPILVIGYPGKDIAVPQELERFDTSFSHSGYYSESGCDGTLKLCGLRYFVSRDPSTYEQDFWEKTEFGVVTPYFRKGFSGAPAFYNGNLIGILTHGANANTTESKKDEAAILTSFDIAEVLIKHGIVGASR